ncbi:MAG: ComEC/Rec2 family competence protein [Treponema sp.]|nr:ComEC/Rec2 family competence protein [Treponema sp.]
MTPAVFAAAGAAAGFYFFHLLFVLSTWNDLIVFLFLLVFILSVLRVLAGSPFIFFESEKTNAAKKKDLYGTVQKTNLYAIALIAGLIYGIAAWNTQVKINIPLAYDQVTGLSGILKDDPRAFNDGRGTAVLELKTAAGSGGVRITAKGNVTVFFPADTIPGLKEFGRGCGVYVEGSLINTDKYNGGLLFRASGVHVIQPAPKLEQFRTAFRAFVMEKFGILQRPGSPDISSDISPEPVWGGLASAMLLGIRDNLDSDLAASFKNAGCSHILSLSGMNLAILSGVIVFFLRLLLGLKGSSLAGAVFIIIYIFLAGAQPSLVRSGIIYLLGALSLWGYLGKNTVSLLSLAFLIQLIIQNESAASVSFLLSYAAMAGILVTGETLRELFAGRIPQILLVSLSASLGAFIATSGISVYFFGELHPIGIIAGILIMPLASLFMILSFAALVLTSIIPVLFAPVNFILTFVYNLIELLVTFAGRAPGLLNLSFMPVTIISVIFIIALQSVKLIGRRHRKYIAAFNT